MIGFTGRYPPILFSQAYRLSSRHRRYIRWHYSLWRSPVGPVAPHRQMGQSRCGLLRLVLVHSGHPRHQHFRELAQRGERHDRAIPELHQHQARAGDLRHYRRVGAVPLGDPRKCAGVLELHERVHGVLGAICRDVSVWE